MSTIGNNIKVAINNNFMHNVIGRSAEGVYNALNTKVKGSENMIVLPQVDKVELSKIDDLHDYKIEGVVTWKPSANKLENAMVFYGIE